MTPAEQHLCETVLANVSSDDLHTAHKRYREAHRRVVDLQKKLVLAEDELFSAENNLLIECRAHLDSGGTL